LAKKLDAPKETFVMPEVAKYSLPLCSFTQLLQCKKLALIEQDSPMVMVFK